MGSGMAKEHPLKKKKSDEEIILTEAERIEEWRRQEFRRILGPATPDDDITTLVLSDADLAEARDLAKDGCPPDLIVKILAPI
jgi:hypothetical protein